MKSVFLIILGGVVFFSAVNVVTARHEVRKLFSEIQQLEKERDNLNEQWGRLQLEQSTWATSSRIESIARNKIYMMEPESQSVILILE